MLHHVIDFIPTIIVPFVLWLMREFRKLDNTSTLTKQMAKDHLPHIYTRLELHDDKLGLQSPPRPNIGIIPNGDHEAAKAG